MSEDAGRPTTSSTRATRPAVRAGPLLGRGHEVARLEALMGHARSGRSGALVLLGEAGVGKTALLDRLVATAPADVRIERMLATEAEMGLPYAGLQMLCGPMMSSTDDLPEPQQQALEVAFGIRDAGAPNPLVLGLAVQGLLARVAGTGTLCCVLDDAQWLDDVSARAIAWVARRLSTERVAVVMATRRQDDRFADLPHLHLTGLDDHDSRELLRSSLPGAIDRRVLDQLVLESRGNPLALRELPRSLSPAELAGGFALAGSMPLESRIEQSLLARLDPLPDATRTMLLLAAADPDGGRRSVVAGQREARPGAREP